LLAAGIMEGPPSHESGANKIQTAQHTASAARWTKIQQLQRRNGMNMVQSGFPLWRDEFEKSKKKKAVLWKIV